jgi:uncharacterized protein YcbX
MSAARLADIRIFPVKSLAGDAQARAAVWPWGLAGDRRWMVVDPAGRFLSQRAHPRMALLHAALRDGALVLSAPGLAPLEVGQGAARAACLVRVWRDIVAAEDAGDAAAQWLGAALGVACRLVHLADPGARKLRAAYAAHAAEAVSFADGFPVLLASVDSLAEVNARLARPVPMLRFRPNLVVAGAAAWAEDGWRRIRIGEAVFRVAKPCDRCVITTRDPGTGLQPDGDEPLRTLATFRRDAGGGIMFGQNLVPERTGAIRVGDAVEVLEAGPPNVALRVAAGAVCATKG